MPIIKKCASCNNEFEISPSRENKRKCCSKKCSNKMKLIIDNDNYRRCNICKEIKTINHFGASNRHRLGREYRCLECNRKKSKQSNRKPNIRFATAQCVARNRKLEWDLTFDDYQKFINNSCVYCGNSISQTGTGLDRQDNNKGYIITNVVACCGRCNRIKSDEFNYNEMLLIGKTIKTIEIARGDYND